MLCITTKTQASLLEKKAMEVHTDQRCDLHSIVSGVVELNGALANEGVKLRSKVPHTFPPFLGDPSRVTQIIQNLVNNASKFCFVGSVTVTAKRREEEGTTSGSPASPTNMVVTIDVRDTGIGIPEEKQEMIFEALRQAFEHSRQCARVRQLLNCVKILTSREHSDITDTPLLLNLMTVRM